MDAAEKRAFEVAERITSLLSEYGIRVPEDIEAEVFEVIAGEYAEVEELAWMYEGLE